MPRVKLQRPTEDERLAAIAKETSLTIRIAMVRLNLNSASDLAPLVGVIQPTISKKLRDGTWTQKELCKLVSVLKIPPEEAVKMLGVRL